MSVLKKYPNLKKTENGERIKCVFTGHEMALSSKAVNQYVNGKKYRNFLKNPTFDLKQFEPHLQPVVTPGSGKKGGKGGGGGGGGGKNVDNYKQLYCQLTQRLINKDPVHILKHVQGYRYVREKFRFDDCVRRGIPYVGIVRSKQKNVQRHEDDGAEVESEDEALGKDKKFSTNPDISESEEEEGEEMQDDLEDLYPKEDFPEEEEEGEKEETEEMNGEQEGSSSEEEEKGFSDSSTSSEDVKKEAASADFKGFPYKLPPPSKRKSSDGPPVKRKLKKKKIS